MPLDITERLRDHSSNLSGCHCVNCEAAEEIERLRALIREIKHFVEIDVDLGLSVEPPHPLHDEKCPDCDWYNESLDWKLRLEAGELDF